MKRVSLFFLSFLIFLFAQSQSIQILTGGAGGSGTSQNVVVGPNEYHVSESIYTTSEIGAGNFESAATAINKIGYNVGLVGSPSQVNNFKVYMKNVPSSTTTFTAGTYSTTGYTLVYNGSVNFSNTGFVDITLSTPFVRTAGRNLQILIERLENVAHTSPFTFYTANGNQTSTTANSSRRYNGATAPVINSTSLSVTSFRPAIELIHTLQKDAKVTDIIHPSVSCFTSPQTIGVEIKNNGLTDIGVGSASVNYKITGPNSFNQTASNTSTIPAGGSVIVNFSGINLNNSGVNNELAKVTMTGDEDVSNDTLLSTFNTATVLNLPLVEDAETTLPVFGNVDVVSGDRQLWSIHTNGYGNPDMYGDSIYPISLGSNFYLFDSYSGSNSTGFSSRLYSNCIQMPSSSATAAQLKFWMTHDTVFTTGLYAASPILDSMYVSVSTDKGVTWTRLAGFARVDPSLSVNTWQQHTVDLSAFSSGQTIQIGFEGASNYGNAIGLDDIFIGLVSSCQSTTTSISYATPFCKSNNTVQAVTISGSGGGTFSATPAGLSINTTTGAINPSLSTPGNYTVKYSVSSSGACTVFFSLANVTILPLTVPSQTTQSACSSYTWNGTTYTQSGVYTFQTTNNRVCDSIAKLILTILPPTVPSQTTQSACSSYTWNGNTYFETGVYTYQTTNAAGCDSFAILNLTIHQPVVGATTNASATTSYTLPWGQVATASGYYTHSYPNAYGCDSLVTVYVVINTPANSGNPNIGINIQNPQRNLHIKDAMRLEPRNTPLDNPAKGDMYFDGVLNKLRVYDGTIWQNCW